MYDSASEPEQAFEADEASVADEGAAPLSLYARQCRQPLTWALIVFRTIQVTHQ